MKKMIWGLLLGIPVVVLSVYSMTYSNESHDENYAIDQAIKQFESAQVKGKEILDKYVPDTPDSQSARDARVREAFIKAKKEGRELSFEEYYLLKNGKKFEKPDTANKFKALQDSYEYPENGNQIQKNIEIDRKAAEAVLGA